MTKCSRHQDVDRQFAEVKEDINKHDAKIEILTSEVTVMKTQFQDIPKALGLGAVGLGVLQTLLFFAQWALNSFGKH